MAILKDLYVDNFRGFSDTFVSFSDVNFLVGENSSGKTSILNLFNLLSEDQFWFSQDFSKGPAHFGHYRDIVSIHSSNSSYFKIGLVRESGPKHEITAHLMSFIERDGLPQLSEYVCNRGQQQIYYRLIASKITYKLENLVNAPSNRADGRALISTWTKKKSDPKEFKVLLKRRSAFAGVSPFPIPLLYSYLQRELSEKKSSPKTFDIEFGTDDPVWIAPIRTKPSRTYDGMMPEYSPEGEHTPYLIRRMLNSKADALKFKEFLGKVGEASGLFQTIVLKQFGNKRSAPFEVDVMIDGKALMIGNVGYGVSQSLPVIVEVLARPKGTPFAIQQPEVHLHPRAQAALGDVFFEMAARDKKTFLIETHSDFTIDRYRMNIRSAKGKDIPSSQILFFNRKNKHNVVYTLPINSAGDLPSDQPDAYRDFFVKEQLQLLSL